MMRMMHGLSISVVPFFSDARRSAKNNHSYCGESKAQQIDSVGHAANGKASVGLNKYTAKIQLATIATTRLAIRPDRYATGTRATKKTTGTADFTA
jgi:hypothetical protein